MAAPPPAAGLPMQFGEAATGACSKCGFSSPPGFAFCGRCGTPLAAAPAPSADVGSAQTIFVGGGQQEPPPPLAMASTDVMQVQIADTEQQSAITAPVRPSSLGTAAPVASSSTAPGSAPVPTPAAAAGVPVRLVMLGADGQPVGERVLAAGEALEVGRDAGPPWDDDAYLDPQHACLRAAEDGIRIEDRNSLNGIFVKLLGRVELRSGDQFRVGQELLVYEELPEPTPTDDGTERMGSPNPGYWGRVSILVDPTMASAAFPIAGEGIGIGRESGDITFPQDGYVSGRHCRIVGDDQGIYLEDLGSSNGTYMRARNGQVVPFGSLVLIGQKLFQLERA
ncbi:MAG: FHA domain-containing protein [Deltaproteobacteria bacterium]|nr:FHA domain-containing protein [Deltaproteobacteria bacterium]MBP7291521.1 FHA domain-containing protein [Nannocystaceae bacterium]